MNRARLAYPLNRGIDGDAGGAADLQTDVMRFMAILALCLVAIFALVQSMPLAPVVANPEAAVDADEPMAVPAEPPRIPAAPAAETIAVEKPPPPIVLTRPTWTPKSRSTPPPQPVAIAAAPLASDPGPVAVDPVPEEPASPIEQQGFTLRFESDLALTRLVASSQVGLYAMTPGRSQRMTVSNSHVSFWDASTPNSFHEMEATTVPNPVISALARTGVDTSTASWGVTLPRNLKLQLDTVTHEHDGGSLVIGMDGQLQLEAPK